MNADLRTAPSSALADGGVCRLWDWGVIRAQGAEAASFLHGQLTQDIVHMTPQAARLAGYCSAKGRLLASFVVWQRSGEELLLACSADLLLPTLKRLSMYVLRAKCKLADASTELPLWGATGAAAQRLLDPAAQLPVWGRSSNESSETLRLPDALVDERLVPRYLVAAAAGPALPTLSGEHWCWLEVHAGVARVQAATLEQFVPQMVNLELVEGVNFKKGCYPGQEVVARSQYRGTTKRRAYVLQAAQALSPGQEVFNSQDPSQPAGRVVLAGTSSDGRHGALAELKITALEGGSLHAGTPDGPSLQPGTLPYALPTAEA